MKRSIKVPGIAPRKRWVGVGEYTKVVRQLQEAREEIRALKERLSEAPLETPLTTIEPVSED